ncbi:hypothetical protein [Paraburkholderia sp. SIMBA_054]|uniref:hypothetical protein n=1 Tax=Paraburkholderia sp. SIMBA_054 TaxID=3085795 RepID=UPI00397E0C8E
MNRRPGASRARPAKPSSKIVALTLSLPLADTERLEQILKPWCALDALAGRHGTRQTFYPLANAIALSGALYSLGLEAEEKEAVITGSAAIAAAFRHAVAHSIWAIDLDIVPMLVKALEVFDRQLDQATRAQFQAAREFVAGRGSARAAADERLPRAA